MEEGLRNLYLGDFNVMFQHRQKDGSVVITLTQIDKNKAYYLHIKDLYGKKEKVLDHKVIDITPASRPWLDERMKKAKEGKEEHG